MSLHKNKQKQRELFQIRNVVSNLNHEFCGDCIINSGEKPDFEIILPDNHIVGLEVTECCPSEKKKGIGIIVDVQFEEKLIKHFYGNKFFQHITESQKLYILIDATREIHKKNNTVKDWCMEFEYHLKQIFENKETMSSPTRLIRRIRFFKTNFRNSINFNHIARRDPIHAKELISVINDKESKLLQYRPELKNNCLLCIYLPWHENRHPYWIEYDDDYSREMFEEDLNKSSYKRIYITSEAERDVLLIRSNRL